MTALALAPNWPTEKVDLIKRTICKGATDDELTMFVQTASRLGLDPFARQVFAVKRWDNAERREVMSIQVSIDGFRLVAERTGKYAGQLGPFWTGDGKEWVEVWLDSKPPAAAKLGVMRHDFKEPVWAVATWEQYKQTKRDGGLTAMWGKMGPLMLAKCAESLALRRAFPNELSGAYTDAEMSQATHEEKPEYVSPAKREAELQEQLEQSIAATAPSAEPEAPAAGAPANEILRAPGDDGTPATAEQKDAIKAHMRKKGWKMHFVRVWFAELFGIPVNTKEPWDALSHMQADAAHFLVMAHGTENYRKIRQEYADQGIVRRDENDLQW